MKMIRKVLPVIAVLAILLLIYFVSFEPGKTYDCNIVPIKSEVYTQEDYEQACSVVFRYFKGFRGCNMTEIRYAGDDELDAMKEWSKEYDTDEVIILESDFTTDSKGGDGSFNPNDTYNDWNWILARDKNGRWKHKDHGYGVRKMNGDYKAFCGYIVLSIIAWLYSLVICRKNHSVLRKREKVCIIISLLLFTAAIISIVLKWNPMWSFFEGGFILVLALWFNASIRNKK